MHLKNIMKQLAKVNASLLNQSKFRHQAVFSAQFDREDEEDRVLDEIETTKNFNFNHNLTQFDMDNIDNRSLLQKQIQNQ